MSIFDKILGLFTGGNAASAEVETAPVAAPTVAGTRVIDRVLVGESLVIDTRPDGSGLDLLNVAHIDLIIGPRGSAAERAFTRTLTTQRKGVNGLLAVVAPNIMTKPATVMFNKVTIKINFIGAFKPTPDKSNHSGNLIFFYDRECVGINRLIAIIKGNQNGFAG